MPTVYAQIAALLKNTTAELTTEEVREMLADGDTADLLARVTCNIQDEDIVAQVETLVEQATD
jgi:hypothetical protein